MASTQVTAPQADPPAAPPAMAGYDSLLVHVQPGLNSSRRTEIAAELARRFGARLIGVGAELVEAPMFGDPMTGEMMAQAYEEARRRQNAELDSAEQAFRRDAAAADSEWRRLPMAPLAALATASRAADLIVTGGREEAAKDVFRSVQPGDLVFSTGRPILIAPPGGQHLRGDAVVVGWKDSREARRAVADALPFLQRAKRVLVAAVGPAGNLDQIEASAADVAQALRRKGVAAEVHVAEAAEAGVAAELNAQAEAIGADLIVAGAYGHNRLREWLFGGVTRGLLAAPHRYLLLSH